MHSLKRYCSPFNPAKSAILAVAAALAPALEQVKKKQKTRAHTECLWAQKKGLCAFWPTVKKDVGAQQSCARELR